MTFQEILASAEHEIRSLGLRVWADKLRTIAQSAESDRAKATKVLALYGGFGTLNDNAFSDGEAANGMSGEEATRMYMRSINALHKAATEATSK
jgi:hypothetical protein